MYCYGSHYNQFLFSFTVLIGARGGAVVEALRYKQEVVGSITAGVNGFFSLT
jgi:hypothetical protein